MLLSLRLTAVLLIMRLGKDEDRREVGKADG